MGNYDISFALKESLFGSLPESVLIDLARTSRVTEVPIGKVAASTCGTA